MKRLRWTAPEAMCKVLLKERSPCTQAKRLPWKVDEIYGFIDCFEKGSSLHLHQRIDVCVGAHLLQGVGGRWCWRGGAKGRRGGGGGVE